MKIQKVKNHLELTNKGTLSLFFVGVGSAFSKAHYQTNLLIVKGNDHLLIDCGSKTPQAFYELNCPITRVQNYFITHSHADHVGGLEEVMLLGRYASKKKPNIYITREYKDILWDMSLKGGAAYNEGPEPLTFEDFWVPHIISETDAMPRKGWEFNIGSINIKTFRTNHIPDNTETWSDAFWSTGVLIDDRILFTSDTRFDPELIHSFEKKFKPERIFHDTQFFFGGVHAGIDELATLPPNIKEKMHLVHYGDNWKSQKKKVRKHGFYELTKQWHWYTFD
jgi:mRNA degradation ribonuclease J1/J2